MSAGGSGLPPAAPGGDRDSTNRANRAPVPSTPEQGDTLQVQLTGIAGITRTGAPHVSLHPSGLLVLHGIPVPTALCCLKLPAQGEAGETGEALQGMPHSGSHVSRVACCIGAHRC